MDDIDPVGWDVIDTSDEQQEEIIQSKNSCKEFQVDES